MLLLEQTSSPTAASGATRAVAVLSRLRATSPHSQQPTLPPAEVFSALSIRAYHGDRTAARKLYRAAATGDAVAQSAYGNLLLIPGFEPVAGDTLLPVEWLRLSAQQNCLEAYQSLGRCYELGVGGVWMSASLALHNYQTCLFLYPDKRDPRFDAAQRNRFYDNYRMCDALLCFAMSHFFHLRLMYCNRSIEV